MSCGTSTSFELSAERSHLFVGMIIAVLSFHDKDFCSKIKAFQGKYPIKITITRRKSNE